jgi:hypothetical protein
MAQRREGTADYIRAEAALRRSLIRIKVAESRKRRAMPTPRTEE